MKRSLFYSFLLLWICLFFGLGSVKGQQDIQFSQYIFNGLSLNPGYAGYKETLNFTTTYRTQWTGLVGAPTTITTSLDGVAKDKMIGWGISILEDNLGPQTTLSALGSLAYRLRLNERSRLSFGVSVGMDQYKLDASKLTTISVDPSLAGLISSQIRPDLQFGLFYASEHYFVGLSGLDLLANYSNYGPGYFVIRRNRHYYFHAGAIYRLNESLSIKPSFLIKEDLLAPGNIDLNTFLIWNKKIWLGLSMRTAFNAFNSKALPSDLSSADALSMMVEYFPNPSLRIGYSYDYSTSHLQEVSNGSHEISIGYFFHSQRYSMLSPRLF
jgi:type IX secretion system PorP/SprF family membrane protein